MRTNNAKHTVDTFVSYHLRVGLPITPTPFLNHHYFHQDPSLDSTNFAWRHISSIVAYIDDCTSLHIINYVGQNVKRVLGQ